MNAPIGRKPLSHKDFGGMEAFSKDLFFTWQKNETTCGDDGMLFRIGKRKGRPPPEGDTSFGWMHCAAPDSTPYAETRHPVSPGGEPFSIGPIIPPEHPALPHRAGTSASQASLDHNKRAAS